MLFFVRGVLLTEVLLNEGRLELSVHELEVLSHLLCVHLRGNHFEQILVSLDGELGCRIGAKESLQELHGLFGSNLHLLKHLNEGRLDLLAHVKEHAFLVCDSSHKYSQELLADQFV